METPQTKCCTRCKKSKEKSDFSDHPKMLDKKQSQCKDCFAERARIKRVGKPCISCGKAKKVGVPKGAKLCLSCAEICFECKKEPRQKQHRLCKTCSSKRDKIRNALPERVTNVRVTRVSSRYRVTREEAVRLISIQNCAACNKLFTRLGDSHIDHCHKTGLVRGVLCFNCNAALGHLKDESERLKMLIQYLEKQ